MDVVGEYVLVTIDLYQEFYFCQIQGSYATITPYNV
jgi:hypothetical protein